MKSDARHFSCFQSAFFTRTQGITQSKQNEQLWMMHSQGLPWPVVIMIYSVSRLCFCLAPTQCQGCPHVGHILQCLQHRDQMEETVIRGVIDPAFDGNRVI